VRSGTLSFSHICNPSKLTSFVQDIESEDSMSPESEDDQADSASGSRPPGQAKPMTTRQAVLASMVDSRHVSLGRPAPTVVNTWFSDIDFT
jgi:hypothetical protein